MSIFLSVLAESSICSCQIDVTHMKRSTFEVIISKFSSCVFGSAKCWMSKKCDGRKAELEEDLAVHMIKVVTVYI